MRSKSDPQQANNVDELAQLIERKAQSALFAAMNAWGAGHPGSSVPKWRDLAELLRHGAELADRIADSEENPR